MTWTAEQTDTVVALYKQGQDPDTIANKVGRTKRSVIAKLTSLGLYSTQPYMTKTGEPVVFKNQLVDQIATRLGVNPEVVESLEKCTKTTLKIILKHLQSKEP